MSDYAKKVNTDSIAGLLKLESPERMDQLKNELNEKYKNWQNKLSQTEYESDIKALEKKVKSIDLTDIKNIDQFQKTFPAVNEVKKSADELTKKIDNDKNGLYDDLDKAKNDLKNVDDWIREDYAKAMSLAKLSDFSAQNIGKLIFGKTVVDKVSQYLGYVETARSYSYKMKSEKPQDEDPPRLEGQDIYFYNKNVRPDFWIHKINLSGTAERVIKLNGEVLNIVSDQRQIGSPTEIKIKGGVEGKSSINLKGVLDYLKELPSETFEVNHTGFFLNNAKLSESKFLPEKVKSGVGYVKANFVLTGDQISGIIKFVANQVVFDFSGQQEKRN